MATKKVPEEDEFSSLSAKQKALVDNYIITRNIQQSAKDAGYSPKTAHQIGSNELKKVEVKRYYQHRIKEITAKNDDKISFVLSRLQEIASADMKDFVAPDGTMKRLDSKVNGRLIQSVKQTMHGTQVTLQSAEKALELMGRYLGMWSDKIDVTTNGNDLGSVTINYQEVTKPAEDSSIEPGS